MKKLICENDILFSLVVIIICLFLIVFLQLEKYLASDILSITVTIFCCVITVIATVRNLNKTICNNTKNIKRQNDIAFLNEEVKLLSNVLKIYSPLEINKIISKILNLDFVNKKLDNGQINIIENDIESLRNKYYNNLITIRIELNINENSLKLLENENKKIFDVISKIYNFLEKSQNDALKNLNSVNEYLKVLKAKFLIDELKNDSKYNEKKEFKEIVNDYNEKNREEKILKKGISGLQNDINDKSKEIINNIDLIIELINVYKKIKMEEIYK